MEDEKIINLYFERNESAILETAQKYGAMIRGIAYNILKNHSDCEECENDTYHVAWNKIPPERPHAFAAFLGRIARNISFDKYRYNKAEKRNADFDILLSEIADCVACKRSVETEADEKMLAEQLDNFLKSIHFTKRVVFIRRYWYCDSIEKIANDFGFSKSKVKSMLMRTRNALKKYLEKGGVVL